jgi:hypothetical protein
LLDDALARIPIHNPEWTNFNDSDPGVTLLQLYAFLTDALLYRANRIPERNRRKFLALLGVPLAPPSSARGLVTITSTRGAPETVTLNEGIEIRAGSVPFRTDRGLDVLPLVSRAFVKQRLRSQPDRLVQHYKQLYASYEGPKPPLRLLELYETVPLDAAGPSGIAVQGTADSSLWIALLLREADPPTPETRAAARAAIAGRTVSLGLVPVVDDPRAELTPTGRDGGSAPLLTFQLPSANDLPAPPAERLPQYRTLVARGDRDVLLHPGVVELTLPVEAELHTWEDELDPLESGVGDFPPSLDDTKLAARVVTWLRIKAVGAAASVLWAGINAVTVSQRAHVGDEALPNGNGEPDQVVTLAHTPVIPETVGLTVAGEPWTRIDDLLAAGPEVPAPDPGQTPGTTSPPPAESRVFAVDAATGAIRLGDGTRGARPHAGASIHASYDYGAGGAGNVAAGALSAAPALPAGMKVTNPVRTWGGAEGESTREGEKQAARFLQHRDRLVSVEDFDSIVRRTPGVELGRVDVLPAFNPELAPSGAGDAAGAVTILVVPRRDAVHPDTPEPDKPFLDAICDWLDPRRIVTTEVFLRGPSYRGIWVSVGVDVVAGESEAVVRERVRAEMQRFLAPVDPTAPPWFEQQPTRLDAFSHPERGWPLGKAVSALELQAVVARVPGVQLVRPVLLAQGTGGAVAEVPMTGLELPRLLGPPSVSVGTPTLLDDIRGLTPPETPTTSRVPVPVIPETC